MNSGRAIPFRWWAVALWLMILPASLLADDTAAKPSPGPPNILFVMTDDQGRWSLGDYSEHIATPNISHLARQGVRFDQAVTPAPVCSAARASVYTGRIPSQHGVHDFLSEEDSGQDGWLAGERLLSEVLSDAGYRVGLFGKWHADTQGWRPVRGFDRWLSYDERDAPWINQYLHSGTVHFSRDGAALRHTGVQARFISEETVRFIDEPDSRPFAAFVNFVEPHFPFSGLPERLVSRYRPLADQLVAAGDFSSLPAAGAATDDLPHREKVAQYLAAVTLVDEQVGRLLDALQGRELLDETLIVFTSDHGHQTGQYGLYGKANATVPQNLYDDSLRVPLIVHGPGHLVKPGQLRNEFVSLLDLFPTLARVAGAAGDLDDYDGPGQSLLPLLRGERLTRFRDLQYAELGNARTVHNGRWKLVRYYHRDPAAAPSDYWFDLVHPLGERRPVPAPSAAQQEQLDTALEAYFSQYEQAEHSGRSIWDQPRHNAMEPWRH